MNNVEKKTVTLGIVLSIAIVLSFCQVSTQNHTFSFNSTSQYSLILLTSFLCITIIDKISISKIHFSNEEFMILGLFISISFSIFNTDHILTSSKRLTVMASTTLIIFLIAKYTIKPQFLFIGFSIGIITVTAISTFYSLIAVVSDSNFINQKPYELVKFNVFGIELQQTIAHREFKLDGSPYNIQRYAGIFPNPNGLGLMTGMSFILSHTLPVRKKIRYPIQTLCLIGLALSLSRMGLLLCVASFIYYSANNTLIRRIICALMIVGLFSFLFGTVSSSDVTLEFNNLTNFSAHQELFQLRERAYLMTKAWLGFLENWPVGVGFGVGAEYLFPNNPETLAVHSVFINAALETGILGVTFLLATWLFPIFTTKTNRSSNNDTAHTRHAIASVLFGLFFAEAFDLSVMRFHYIHLIFFFLLGTWSALGRDLQDTAINDAQCSDTPQTLSKQMESGERCD